MSDLVRVRTAHRDVTTTRAYAEGLGAGVEILEGVDAVDGKGRPLPPAPKGERRVTKTAAKKTTGRKRTAKKTPAAKKTAAAPASSPESPAPSPGAASGGVAAENA